MCTIILQRNSAECKDTNLLTLLMGIKEILQGPRICVGFMQAVDRTDQRNL